MIKKLRIDKLEKGMYVSGFQKDHSDKALFFMNSLLIKTDEELKEFYDYGYRSAYVDINDVEERPLDTGGPAEPGREDPRGLKTGLKGIDEYGPANEPPEQTKAQQADLEDDTQTGHGPGPAKLGLLPSKTAMDETTEPETAEMEAAPPETDKTDETVDTPDIDAASQEGSAKEPVEEAPRQSAPEGQETETNPEEAPAKHIRLVDTPADIAMEEPRKIEVVADTAGYKEEIEKASIIRDDAEVLVREFMHDKQGELKPERVHQAVEQMVDSIFRNRDALSSLVRLKSADDYTFGHCVNVCILSMALGRQMGFTKKTAHDLGVGAVLHDIGKTRIQERTLQKPGPLSDTEFDEIRTHPVLGAELLLDAAGIKDESKHVVVQHHEKYNGTGYPYKKDGDRIHVFARIAAVADVYDAMTSTRVYQKNLPPDIVLQKMYMWRDVHFEPNIVERLIKCLGIYPIGTLVELNTGEVAVVTATNPNNPIKPEILVLFDEEKVRMPKPIEVNLNSEVTRWVVESKDPQKFGVDIEDIIA